MILVNSTWLSAAAAACVNVLLSVSCSSRCLAHSPTLDHMALIAMHICLPVCSSLLSSHNGCTTLQAATVESLLDHPGVFFSPCGGNGAVGLILEINGRKTSTTATEKRRPLRLDRVPARCVVAAAKRERKAAIQSHWKCCLN